MSLTISLPAASSTQGTSVYSSAARPDERRKNGPGSFGEALSRSLKPAKPVAETSTRKAAAPNHAKHKPDNHETDKDEPDAPVNLNALMLDVPDSKVGKEVKATSGEDTLATVTTAEADAGIKASTQIPPEPALAGGIQKNDAQTPLQAIEDQLAEGATPKPETAIIAAPQVLTDTSPRDRTVKREDAVKTSTTDIQAADDQTFIADKKHSPVKDVGSPVTQENVAPALNTPTAQAMAVAAIPPTPPDGTIAAAAFSVSQSGAAAQAAVSAPLIDIQSTAVPASVIPEVGSSEWGKALGHQLAIMGNAGHQVAELQLNPPDLGPLKVTLSMNNHEVQAMFFSAHSSVRTAVESALPQLRATLADNGISLGNTSVSAESNPQAGFAQNQNGQPDQRNYFGNGRPEPAPSANARLVTEPLRHGGGSTVDTYA